MADTRDEDTVPASPPPAVLDAFRKQLTSEFMRDARRYARKRAKLVRAVGRRNDPSYHQDLVQQALADIWSGAAVWDPGRRPLLDHVRDLIRQRTFNDRRRLRHRQQVSIYAPNHAANDEVSLTSLSIEAQMSEAHPSRTSISPLLVSRLVDRVVLELHRLAARDEGACAILGCWASGVIDASDVMTLTELNEVEYHRARIRILYLAKHLPPELREAAQELLRSVS
jgi:hypothetical protein